MYGAIIIGGGPAGLNAARVLGRARRRTLLFEDDFERGEALQEMTRLKKELSDLDGKIQRQLGHLEAEDPGSRAAVTLRDRLGELADMRSKKERQLGAQERVVAERPSPQRASSLLELLPITVVDIDRMGKDAFRELLEILSFEGSFQPTGRILGVSVKLLPELAAEEGPFTRVLSVLLTGCYSNQLAGLLLDLAATVHL